MVVEPEIFALVFVVAGLSPEVVLLAAGPEVVAPVFVVSEPSPEVAVLADGPEVAEPGVAFVSGPQASVDIAVAFVVLVPASVVAGEVDSSGRPKSLAFPSVGHFASPSSSAEVFG